MNLELQRTAEHIYKKHFDESVDFSGYSLPAMWLSVRQTLLVYFLTGGIWIPPKDAVENVSEKHGIKVEPMQVKPEQMQKTYSILKLMESNNKKCFPYVSNKK